MAQLDQVTQQNAALVEESAAAAESLSQQAARLVEAVSVFTLDGREQDPGRPGPGAAKPRPAAVVAVAPGRMARKVAQPRVQPRPQPAAAEMDEWAAF